jgi:hypothetical protein
VQPVIEIANGESPDIPVTNLTDDHCCFEIEVGGAIKRQVTFADVPFVLAWVVRDLHSKLYMQFRGRREILRDFGRRSGGGYSITSAGFS